MYARYYVNFLDLRIYVVFCVETGHEDGVRLWVIFSTRKVNV